LPSSEPAPSGSCANFSNSWSARGEHQAPSPMHLSPSLLVAPASPALSSTSLTAPGSARGSCRSTGANMRAVSPISLSTAGAAWNSEGPSRDRLSLHRDSMDLQSNASHKSHKSSASSFYKDAKSKLIGILGRDHSAGDQSDDEIDLRRWSLVSDARETALMTKEPKKIPTRRLSFRTFAKGDTASRLSKALTGCSQSSQNRSYTPPRNRDAVACAATTPGSMRSQSNSKTPPRCRSPGSFLEPYGSRAPRYDYMVGVLGPATADPVVVEESARLSHFSLRSGEN